MVIRRKTAEAEAPWEKEAGAPAKKAAATKAAATKAAAAKKAAVKGGLPSSESAEEKKEVGPPPEGLFPKGQKAPKTIAAGADLYKSLEAEEKAAKAVLAAAEEKRKWVKAWILQELPKTGATGVAGMLCKVQLAKKETPRAEDWPKVYATIVADYQAHVKKKTGMQDSAFALLQKRLGESAIKEVWDAGKAVPGVSKFTYTDLSVTKL